MSGEELKTVQQHIVNGDDWIAMRILILTYNSITEVGGVEGRGGIYTRGLTESGHRVHLYDVSRSAKEGRFGDNVSFLSSSITKIHRNLSIIVKKIRTMSPDVIFILTGADSIIGLSMLIYARIIGIKSGAFLYGKDILSARRNPFRYLTLMLGVLLAKKLGANSMATANLLPAYLRRKLSILYPGVDPAISIGMDTVGKAASKTILFVGRLIKRKDADDLIKAFSMLLKEVPDARLEIVGDGSEKMKLENLTVELRVQDQVCFFGELVGRELYRRYADCAVFCMPSKSLKDDVEGFGTVFLEAGLFGKPSVTTWSGGIPEAVIDGETGILVKEGDVIALKNALARLLKDRSLSEKLGEKARLRVLTEFTSRDATQRLLDMFA